MRNGIAVDKNGNVYVVGSAINGINEIAGKGSDDGFLSKYDKEANLLWTKIIGSISNDYAYGIAVDIKDNIFVIGSVTHTLNGVTTNGEQDIFVIKYDSNANLLWTRVIGSNLSEIGNSVATDINGNAYVTGYTSGSLNGNTYNGGIYDGYLIKLDLEGNLLWTQTFGTNSKDLGTGVAVDKNGDILVVGQTDGDLNGMKNLGKKDDGFIIKFDSNGNTIWTRQVGTALIDTLCGIAVEKNANFYVVGHTSGNLNGEHNSGNIDAFLMKYDLNGNLLWSRFFKTQYDDIANAVAINNIGDVYVTGETLGSLNEELNSGGFDAYVAKFNSNGDLLWTRSIKTTGEDKGYAVAADDYGVYVTGYVIGQLNGNNQIGYRDVFVFFIYCDISCIDCSIDSKNFCISCSPGYNKISTSNFPTQCFNSLPDVNYYFDTNSNSYSICKSPCYECSGSEEDCISCINGKYLVSVKRCGEVPFGYYINNVSKTIEKCHVSCNSCVNSADNCLECFHSDLINPLKNYYNKIDEPSKCYLGDTKLISHFLDLKLNKFSPCDKSCLNCVDQPENCIECNKDYYSLYDNKNKCVSTCPDGTYPNLSLLECSKCKLGCETCIDRENCIACSKNYYTLHDNINECVSTCPVRTYPNLSLLECSKCKLGCETCKDGDTCIECEENYFTLYNNEKYECVSKCPHGTYTNFFSFKCVFCKLGCKTCLDGNSCSECLEEFHSIEDIKGECISNLIGCPREYYLEKINNVCIRIKSKNEQCKNNEILINIDNIEKCVKSIECIENAFINTRAIFGLTNQNYKCEFLLISKNECKEYTDLYSVKWENSKFIKKGRELNVDNNLFDIAKFYDDNKSFIIERDSLDQGYIELNIDLLYKNFKLKSYHLNVKFIEFKVILILITKYFLLKIILTF